MPVSKMSRRYLKYAFSMFAAAVFGASNPN
jgi:hypothetical protein